MLELESVQSKCPHAKFESVPGGHFCMSWERATDIAGHARTFLV